MVIFMMDWMTASFWPDPGGGGGATAVTSSMQMLMGVGRAVAFTLGVWEFAKWLT